MRLKLSLLLASIATISAIIGCGGGSDTVTIHKLIPEENATAHKLFYGEVSPTGLGSLFNVRVIDANGSEKIIVENNDTSVIRRPVVSTAMKYDPKTNSYENLEVKTLDYASGTTAFRIDMKNGSQKQKWDNLSDFDYTTIDYLGSKQYLVAKDSDTNQTLLITPENNSKNFGNRELLSLTYDSYGDAPKGYLVYNNDNNRVETCSLNIDCNLVDDLNVSSRDYEGDIAGTTYSVFLSGNTLYRLDKADNTVKEISLDGKEIVIGHGTTDFQGESFYFIGKDQNLYRVNVVEEKVVKVTPSPDDRLERIRAFTNGYVIYGSDTILKAAKKDGTTKEPILLAEMDKTKGYKYVKEYGIGDKFLFVKYNVDTEALETRFEACIFDEADSKNPQCKKNSFWAGATIKREGKLNFESSFQYTPYAYIRVDDTDAYGGGTLKAINPKYPLEDGISMGSIPNYNFQTFISNSSYVNEMVDSDGGVIFYAKNDLTYHVDAFYMNLFKENSLKQLTDTNPEPDIAQGRDHCHGRSCFLCHSFAGGKIYTDLDGGGSAYGYRVRLDFEDGTTFLSKVAKGRGENFSIPLKELKSNFHVSVLDANDSVVNQSGTLDHIHGGVAAANCNFCHARYGNTRYLAPGTISIKPKD